MSAENPAGLMPSTLAEAQRVEKLVHAGQLPDPTALAPAVQQHLHARGVALPQPAQTTMPHPVPEHVKQSHSMLLTLLLAAATKVAAHMHEGKPPAITDKIIAELHAFVTGEEKPEPAGVTSSVKPHDVFSKASAKAGAITATGDPVIANTPGAGELTPENFSESHMRANAMAANKSLTRNPLGAE